ncbi:hypothetical protein GDO81_008012 [Engystomops pustulosus]|uniref:Uncharacterized protein n=1 Tax=Engystomops pustulosus TaxID=76066 RepID=A0AAV7CBS9_ENGPU|nr:hypothetical protein GDO81_008012 [Engystomops pustulosus]
MKAGRCQLSPSVKMDHVMPRCLHSIKLVKGDTEDYQQKRVYRWQDSNFQGFRNRQKFNWRSSSSSSDRTSDSR